MINPTTFPLTAVAALALSAPAMALQVTVDLKHMDDPARDCERIEVRSELPKTKGQLNYVTYRGGCAGLEQRGGSEHTSLAGDSDNGEAGEGDAGSGGGSDESGGGKGGSHGDGGHGGDKGGHGGKGGGKGPV